MEKWLKLHIIYSFSTSPHSCCRCTLLNTKVLNFTVYKEKMKNYVRTLSYFHQFNNFWYIHDKIAETLCFVLKVCPAPRTQALRRERHWPIAASTIDWTKRHLVDQTHIKFADVSYCGLVNFLLQCIQYTPDARVDWVQIR